ncbi:hypothetical protein CDAR_321151 [Caerostris darwini]|uniref:Uncharacterized protein n=1 Tax=Caerostris darwini TaxID=1538125 RepID=A0AAV4WX74_9ARAC|nr:hypothetical protein CDAR_321151 [Caerostris darwini]
MRLYCRGGRQGDVHREPRQTPSGNRQREDRAGHPQSGQLFRRDQHLEHGNGGEQADRVRQVRGILGPLLPLQAGHVGCPEGLSRGAGPPGSDRSKATGKIQERGRRKEK